MIADDGGVAARGVMVDRRMIMKPAFVTGGCHVRTSRSARAKLHLARIPRDRGASTRSVGRPHTLVATPPADTWSCVVSGTSCEQVCRVTDPPLAGLGLNGVPQPRVIGIFLGSVPGSSGTGMRTSRTPSLYDAWTSSWCTPAGSVTVREKVP